MTLPAAPSAVELVTIGDELLLGQTIDTNAAHLARELAAIGVSVARRATCGDDADDIAGAVREALERTGAVVTTGGLGPTSDDRTKEAIAGIFGQRMVMDERHADWLRARWKERGWPGELPASNLQQAMLPERAVKLENRHGSAPGVWLEDERGRWVAMLPGVPREMRGMLADVLLPRVRGRLGGRTTVVRTRTVRTTGIAESALADHLGDLARGVDGLPLAYLPGWEGVDLRLTARGLDERAAEESLDVAAAKLHARIGAHAYGEQKDDLAAIVLELCRTRGLSIAVAESCTGGLLGGRLTAVSGASAVFVGGVIAYDNRVKTKELGVRAQELVEHGAVSETVAVRMASEVRLRYGTDIGVGITGVAGPGGGTPEKPVGTVWIAADAGGSAAGRRFSIIGDREEIRLRATQSALDMIRRILLKV